MSGMQLSVGTTTAQPWLDTGETSSLGLGGLALVVADGPIQASAWKNGLRAQGFRVRVRYGGHEGLDALEQEPPVLLVLDLWRSGMDALTFLKISGAVHPDLAVATFVTSSPCGALDGLLTAAGADEVLHGTPTEAGMRGLLACHGLVGSLRGGILPSGARIADRFVVDTLIGRGATAAVYRVTDLELGEQVALKLLDCTDSVPGAVERFRQEMRICRRLQHTHVVRTFEYGIWQGQPFFTMELLRGRTLRGFIEERGSRPVPVAVGVPLVVQACRALAAAHALGVVHRDIKPDNLFVLDGERHLKVMDFGIAKTREPGALTSTQGLVLGTPAYVAPERINGSTDAGPSSDIYSLGVVLFELFCGRVPFEGGSIGSLLARVVNQEPPDPSELNPLLPEAIRDAILMCLAKDPADRPADARALERLLTDVL